MEPGLASILNGQVSAEEAADLARRSLEEPSPDPRWCIPLAFSLWKQGSYGDAYDSLAPHHSALQNNVEYLLLYGMVARLLPDHLGEAEAALKGAVRLDPTRHDAYYNLGNLYFSQDRFEEALKEYRLSLERNNRSALCWLNFGLAARSLDQLDLSLEALRRSIQLDPENIRAWCNYGISCHQLEDFGSAIKAYYRALSLDQLHGPTLLNLGQALNASNRHPEAVEYLQAASTLTLQEDCGDALFNLALTRLLLGEYEIGWELYECRFKTRQHDVFTKVPQGEWIQSPRRLRELVLHGSEIFVWSEQGLGDAIQFVRYIHLLHGLGLKPVLSTRPSLVRLFKEWLMPEVEVIDDNQVDISAELGPHTAMLSLPHLLGTTRNSIPASLPYLHPPGPPPEALLVPSPPGGLAVGLVWASNPDNKLMYRRKSLPLPILLEPLLPALREDLLELHCLQVGQDAECLSPYSSHPNIVNWNGRLGDFADTAHVVRQLDLVISVDTGVAHLAAALGIQTWLMLHYDADFRWMRECETSPWYPGMRLFRQHTYGDWSTMVQQLLDELGKIYGLDLLALR